MTIVEVITMLGGGASGVIAGLLIYVVIVVLPNIQKSFIKELKDMRREHADCTMEQNKLHREDMQAFRETLAEAERDQHQIIIELINKGHTEVMQSLTKLEERSK